MRKHNIYQDMTAARMNAIQILNEDERVKHVVYGERTSYHSPNVVYNRPLVFYYDETFQKYIDTNPAEVLYTIHWKAED